jgi:hypothetical protein
VAAYIRLKSILDKDTTAIATKWTPELEAYKRWHDRLVVKVDKVMYGLIHSAKLWYKR